MLTLTNKVTYLDPHVAKSVNSGVQQLPVRDCVLLKHDSHLSPPISTQFEMSRSQSCMQ
jgi:hypothetical protein